MSKALLFSFGLSVFAVTIYGALFYGYVVFSRFYVAQVASEAARNVADSLGSQNSEEGMS